MTLKFIEIKIPKDVLKGYLEAKFGRPIEIKEYKRIGTGWHATGYRIRFIVSGEEKTIILKTLRPEGFSHDFASDRAGVFLLQHELAQRVKNHISSYDVGGYTEEGKILSLSSCKEFFHIVEVAKGRRYLEDLKRFMKENSLKEEDKNIALMISDYLIRLHQEKFYPEGINDEHKEAIARSIYRRNLRDCIGHGEMTLGVIDTYPDDVSWTTREELTDIITKSFDLKERLKGNFRRLCRIHGDFHPGNILLEDGNVRVMDASRFLHGEPANDVVCLTLNYVWYAIQQTGRFEGVFKKLAELFWNNYVEKTKDDGIEKIAPLYTAYLYTVMAHSLFFPDQTDDVRKKLFAIIKGVFSDGRLYLTRINTYVGKVESK